MEVLNLATMEKQNEILAKPSGTDFTVFQRHLKTAEISILSNQTCSLIDITGAGFIGMCLAISGTNTSLKITVDGVIYTFLLDNTWKGITQVLQNDATYNKLRGANNQTAAIAWYKDDGAIPLASPLFFKDSLKIEVINSENAQRLVNYIYDVGVLN